MLDSAIADNGLVQPPSNSRVNYHRFNPLYRPRFLNRVPPSQSFWKINFTTVRMPILALPRGDFQAGPRTNDSINSVNSHPLRIPIFPPNFNRCVDYVRLKGYRIRYCRLKITYIIKKIRRGEVSASKSRDDQRSDGISWRIEKMAKCD